MASHQVITREGRITQSDDDENDGVFNEMNSLLEERTNAAHVMHVLFATYRQYTNASNLFNTILSKRSQSNGSQFNFILYYWLNNYPEDFSTTHVENQSQHTSSSSDSIVTNTNSSCSSFNPITLADHLIATSIVDEEIKKHCLHLLDMKHEKSIRETANFEYNNRSLTNTNRSISELAPRFIAQQLIAIDLVGF